MDSDSEQLPSSFRVPWQRLGVTDHDHDDQSPSQLVAQKVQVPSLDGLLPVA